jgi:hypothetical protein
MTPLVSSTSRWLFVLCLLATVLSVLLRCMNSDYPFGIFKLFLLPQYNINCHVFVPVANQDLDFQRDMS